MRCGAVQKRYCCVAALLETHGKKEGFVNETGFFFT
jgi:hypothetical protein